MAQTARRSTPELAASRGTTLMLGPGKWRRWVPAPAKNNWRLGDEFVSADGGTQTRTVAKARKVSVPASKGPVMDMFLGRPAVETVVDPEGYRLDGRYPTLHKPTPKEMQQKMKGTNGQSNRAGPALRVPPEPHPSSSAIFLILKTFQSDWTGRSGINDRVCLSPAEQSDCSRATG